MNPRLGTVTGLDYRGPSLHTGTPSLDLFGWIFLFLFFSAVFGLNSGLCPCKAGIPLLQPHLQPEDLFFKYREKGK